MVAGKRDFDVAAAGWDEEPRRVKLAQDVAAAILREVPIGSEAEALDLGCGTGLVTLALQPWVRSITGLDSSAGMLARLEEKARAQGLGNVRWLQADLAADATVAAPGSFDLVVSSMTLHHVLDVPGLLLRLHALLRSGGWLALADLDPDGGEFHEDPAGVHHPGFSRPALRTWAEAAGLREVRFADAARITRQRPDGPREFSVFLLVARRP
jgi:tRNA (cmo5U34)-methyltransferase